MSSQRVEPSKESDVLVIGEYENGSRAAWYWCPVCNSHHVLPLKGTPQPPGIEDGPQWEWNGDKVNPSLMPSVKSTGWACGKHGGVCHHYVTKGQIFYLADTTHGQGGKAVPMERPPVAITEEEGAA